MIYQRSAFLAIGVIAVLTGPATAQTVARAAVRDSAGTISAANPIARYVKLADVTENMDPTRIAEPTDRDHQRIAEYQTVKQLLDAACPPR